MPYEAPLERLLLLEVAGRPAIAQLPIPGFAGTLRLAVIERRPSPDKPGIVVAVDNTTLTLEGAVELAERLLGGPP